MGRATDRRLANRRWLHFQGLLSHRAIPEGNFWRGIMQLRKWVLTGLTMVLGLGGLSAVSAQTLPLERFGNVFALSVCGRFAPAGSARCYAKVVTDARG